PTTLQGAVAALAQHGEAARPMAGGHSLLPMMKLRLASPDVLIDINALSELHGVAIGPDEVTIGAATTHATLEHHAALAQALPPGELIVAVRIPVQHGVRAAYRKFRHPASGYAVVGVAVVLRFERGNCCGGQIAVTGLADCAFRAKGAEVLLAGFTGQADRI